MIEPPWRENLKTLVAPTFGMVALSLGTLAYAYHIEPGWVEIQSMQLDLPSLEPEFAGYRLAQISDLHMDNPKAARPLAEIVQRVNQLRPDLVVITGDFITRHPGLFAGELASILKELVAPDGVFAVLGNHDHDGGAKAVRTILRKAGITELANAVHTLRRGEAALHLAGIDDYMTGHSRLDTVLKWLPASGPAILLAHEPDFADISAATSRFALQLSGHTHGGQIRLPLIGPLYLPRYGRKYPQGLYQVGKMLLYTNRGLGTVHLPVRFRTRPEITVFILQPLRKSRSPRLFSDMNRGDTGYGELERDPGSNSGRRRKYL